MILVSLYKTISEVVGLAQGADSQPFQQRILFLRGRFACNAARTSAGNLLNMSIKIIVSWEKGQQCRYKNSGVLGILNNVFLQGGALEIGKPASFPQAVMCSSSISVTSGYDVLANAYFVYTQRS